MPKTIIDCTGRRLYRREVEGEPIPEYEPPKARMPEHASTWQRILLAIIATAALVSIWRM